jgi:predicted ATP-grasp superfamily ATP-dependent carboligase
MSNRASSNGVSFVVQQFIQGKPASLSFSALKGELLGCFAFEAESTISKTGFTTIVREIESIEMKQAAQDLARYFTYNGFGGLDFILDENGLAWLLEINSRPTQTAHLGSVLGNDLCLPLFAKLSNTTYQPNPKISHHLRIALFPNAWEQNIKDLQNFKDLVDVPWNDPELLAKIIANSWQNIAH